MTTNRDIRLELQEIIYDYQGLRDLLLSYEALATLFSSADDLDPERTGVLLDCLNCRLNTVIESLKGIEKSIIRFELHNS